MTNRVRSRFVALTTMCLSLSPAACSSGATEANGGGGSAAVTTPALDAGPSAPSGPSGPEQDAASDAGLVAPEAATGSIPGPLFHGGALRLPSSASYVGVDALAGGTKLTITIADTMVAFGGHWAINFAVPNGSPLGFSTGVDLVTGDVVTYDGDGGQAAYHVPVPKPGDFADAYVSPLTRVSNALQAALQDRQGPLFPQKGQAALRPYADYLQGVIASYPSTSPLVTAPPPKLGPGTITPLYWGGSLSTPVSATYSGVDPGDTETNSFTIVISNSNSVFPGHWSIDVITYGFDRTDYETILNVETGAVHNAVTISGSPLSASDDSPTSAAYARDIASMHDVLAKVAAGRSAPNWPEPATPDLVPYRDYLASILLR